MKQFRYHSLQEGNNKGAQETVWIPRLVYAFVGNLQRSPIFSRQGSYIVYPFSPAMCTVGADFLKCKYLQQQQNIFSTLIMKQQDISSYHSPRKDATDIQTILRDSSFEYPQLSYVLVDKYEN